MHFDNAAMMVAAHSKGPLTPPLSPSPARLPPSSDSGAASRRGKKGAREMAAVARYGLLFLLLWSAVISRGFGSEAGPAFSWVRSAGSMYAYTNGTLSLRSALAVDQAGNVYVTVGFRGRAAFGTNA